MSYDIKTPASNIPTKIRQAYRLPKLFYRRRGRRCQGKDFPINMNQEQVRVHRHRYVDITLLG